MNSGDEIRLVFSKRQLKGFLALAVLIGAACSLMSESFTLSTYYPAPSGVYNQMITTGKAYLARDCRASDYLSPADIPRRRSFEVL